MTLEKRCCDCREVKPMGDFYPRARNGNGKPTQRGTLGAVEPRCKRCSNRNRVRDRWRMTNGLTASEYIGMVIAQCGACAICGETETASSRTRPQQGGDRRGTRRLNVDHDHATGVIRALLCLRCNTAIGLLGNPDLLRRAASYLEEYRARS